MHSRIVRSVLDPFPLETHNSHIAAIKKRQYLTYTKIEDGKLNDWYKFAVYRAQNLQRCPQAVVVDLQYINCDYRTMPQCVFVQLLFTRKA